MKMFNAQAGGAALLSLAWSFNALGETVAVDAVLAPPSEFVARESITLPDADWLPVRLRVRGVYRAEEETQTDEASLRFGAMSTLGPLALSGDLTGTREVLGATYDAAFDTEFRFAARAALPAAAPGLRALGVGADATGPLEFEPGAMIAELSRVEPRLSAVLDLPLPGEIELEGASRFSTFDVWRPDEARAMATWTLRRRP